MVCLWDVQMSPKQETKICVLMGMDFLYVPLHLGDIAPFWIASDPLPACSTGVSVLVRTLIEKPPGAVGLTCEPLVPETRSHNSSN